MSSPRRARVRLDVEELLRKDLGLPNAEVARRTGASPKSVARRRQVLGLPPRPAGRPTGSSTPRSLYAERVQAVEGGHLEWVGSRNCWGVPVITWAGRPYTAYRVAFVMHNGRGPVGRVMRGCLIEGCVAPRCMTDQPMRDRLRETYAAIFGSAR